MCIKMRYLITIADYILATTGLLLGAESIIGTNLQPILKRVLLTNAKI